MRTRNKFGLLLAAMALLSSGNANAATEAYVTNNVSPGGTVTVVNLATQKITGNIPINKYGPDVIAMSPDGSKAYVTNDNNADDNIQLSVINTSTNTISVNIAMTKPDDLGCDYVAVNPAGTRAYVTLCSQSGANITSYIAVIDTSTNKVVNNIALPLNSLPATLAISPDGTEGFVTDINNEDILILSTSTGKVLGTIGTYSTDITTAHTAIGDKLFIGIGGFGSAVQMYDIKTGATSTFVIPDFAVVISSYGIAVNPSDTTVYVKCLGAINLFQPVPIPGMASFNISSGQLISFNDTTVGAGGGNMVVDPNDKSVYLVSQASNPEGIAVYDATSLNSTGFIPMSGTQYDPLYMAVTATAR